MKGIVAMAIVGATCVASAGISRVLVGHNTDAAEIGIRLLDVDAETGAMKLVREISLPDAIYMAISPDQKQVYVAHRDPSLPKGHDGVISRFSIQGDQLMEEARVATGETVPCHLSLMPDGKTVLFAEYSHGTCGAVRFPKEGKPLFAGSLCHVGQVGPRRDRQDAPHAHCAVSTPDGKYVCAVDLGLDEVRVYAAPDASAAMRPLPEKTLRTTPAGAGPRHLIFHPNGKLAFLIFELGNLVSSYRYQDGSFTLLDQQTLLPPAFTDFSKAAAIKLSADGTRLFCSNRGHDSIAAFDIDLESGKLRLKNIMPLGGEFPRDFAFLPGEKILLAGLKMSGKVRTYRYDRAACTLTPVAELGEGHWYRPLYFGILGTAR